MDSATSSARDSEAKDKETTITKNKLPLQSWDYEENNNQKQTLTSELGLQAGTKIEQRNPPHTQLKQRKNKT